MVTQVPCCFNQVPIIRNRPAKKSLLNLTYVEYASIRFDSRQALWVGEGLPFQIEFFLPGFYHKPGSVQDVVNFVVARILDQLGIAHDLVPPWEGPEQG